MRDIPPLTFLISPVAWGLGIVFGLAGILDTSERPLLPILGLTLNVAPIVWLIVLLNQ
jgi:hypothetical protein